MMKITDKVLSLPPYISTSWKNILSLHVETKPYGHSLIIELRSQSKVEIPNLDPKIVDTIFSMHAQVLEHETESPSSSISTQTFALPFSLPMSLPIEGLTSIMQHNQEQASTPPLPPEVLEKIKSLKAILPEDLASLSKPEPHCNCPYCQILRALIDIDDDDDDEEEITEEDLKFRTWDIKQENDKLFSVTNPLDQKEHYSVFLGDPLGCTCGHQNCEHLQAVLRS